jgi:hypothetical protein
MTPRAHHAHGYRRTDERHESDEHGGVMREHHHLQILIERMQREGYPERSIHEAVRLARGEQRRGPERRPSRFRVFRRGRQR